MIVKGAAGGSNVDFLSLILKEENASYQELFSVWKHIIPSQSYPIKNHENTLRARTVIRNSPKINSKIYDLQSPPTVFEMDAWNLVIMF